MLDKITHIEINGNEYPLCFNLNVMEVIQEEYGSVKNWAESVEKDGEPMIKDVKFGFTAMINEGIEIENENKSENRPLLTQKQVARIIGSVGIDKAGQIMKQITIDSAKVEEDENSKNA